MSVSTIMGVPIASIAKINGIPIGSIAKWNGETIDTGASSPFITEWVIPSDSLSLTLPLNNSNGSTFNCTVDWGDSSSSTITAVDDADRVHTYASAGTYEVKITGTCEGWSFNNKGDRIKLTKVKSFGKGSSFTGFKYLAGGFYGCTNITTLGSDPIKPSGDGVTNFAYCFCGCASLTTIPADLLRYNTSALDYYYTFYNCTSLTLRADIFYPSGEQSTRFLNKSVEFVYCFERATFTGAQGTAPDLWNCDFGTGSSTKADCFEGAGNNSTSLSNFTSIPTEWKT